MHVEDEIHAIHAQMLEHEREAQQCLAAQKMAAGDDTHYFRRSLVEFCMWDHGVSQAEATAHVNEYLYQQKGRHFPRRFMRRTRKTGL